MINTVDSAAILAVILGMYYAASGLGGVLDPQRWMVIVRELDGSPYNQLVGGLLALGLGGILIALADPRGDWLELVLFVMGCAAVITGLGYLAMPGPLLAMARPIVAGAARPVSFIIMLFGLALIVAGLTHSS